MRTSFFILTSVILTVQALLAAPGYGQGNEQKKISLDFRNVPIRKVFSAIQAKADVVIMYENTVLKDQKVNITVKDQKVADVLDALLKDKALKWNIRENVIRIEAALPAPEKPAFPIIPSAAGPITGRILSLEGQPLEGASIRIKGSKKGTTSDKNGQFSLDASPGQTIIVSYTGYQEKEVVIGTDSNITITLQLGSLDLEEVTVSTGYWTTEKRKSVGNISKVTAKDIEKQPVTNPLLALQGRMTGVEIAPTTGTPGGAVTIQIRGQNSLRTTQIGKIDGSLPLYVIDGIPIDATPQPSGSTSLLLEGYDPLANINPANIESIQVLKDADATAIYGSRGANGVVLITTKNRKSAGSMNVDLNWYKGAGKIVERVKMMDTKQYLSMMHEAINNDGGPTAVYYDDPVLGPILFASMQQWDTMRYTNWQDKLLGYSSKIDDAQVNFSGGNGQTSFTFGSAYHRETLLFPGDFGYKRYVGSFSLNHRPANSRFQADLSVNYGSNSHNIFNSNVLLTNLLLNAPTAPEIYKPDGTFNWEENSFGLSSWTNPFSQILVTHKAKGKALTANASLSYALTNAIGVSLRAGYANSTEDETINTPISSLDPTSIDPKVGKSSVRSDERGSWIIEPQLTYHQSFNHHHINALLGGTLQEGTTNSKSFLGTGYTSDALLGTLAGATKVTSERVNSEYRYMSGYARIGYDYKNRYLTSLTIRRDGSSRFGPGNRYGNFGALGLGWIFSNESFVKRKLSFISFGKLRASYGTTGNDQIGNSKYLSTYKLAPSTYGGQTALLPASLFNPDYFWEKTRKLEAGLELGLLKDKISIEAAWYRNRSSNQLVQYTLPEMTGFAGVLANFDALVENSGWEFSATTRNISGENFSWITSFNISFPKNKLVSFKGVESSAYRNTFQEGSPLSITRTYVWKGVNPDNGLHEFEDLNGDGQITTADQTFTKSLKTFYFGGLNNTFRFKQLELGMFLQFSSRNNRIGYIGAPGIGSNVPLFFLDRWQKPGDITDIQKFTTGNAGPGVEAYNNWFSSDAGIDNVKFLRLKTLTFSYALPNRIADKAHLKSAGVFLQGQNLFTITNFEGWDPETLWSAPPLRILSVGIQCRF